MYETQTFKRIGSVIFFVALFAARRSQAQVDPEHRALLEGGYDEPLQGQSPLGGYAFFYYNNPDLFNTNAALRVALAPTYLNSELGFKHLLSPYTDVGVGVEGGGYGDDYYEVRQGKYVKAESFNGYGGGMSASIYQLLDPGLKIPLTLVARGGFHYATFHDADQTSPAFSLPQAQFDPFTRVGLRLAGQQPLLYPALGMELSVWYERQWRLDNDPYGFSGDRTISSGVNLYWVFAGMDYTFVKTGQRLAFAFTAGDSTDADRFSAWRLGGVLPMSAEYPLMIPGYFYEELTATRFVHFYASYDFPLDPGQLFKFRLEGAAADVEYLPGFEQRQPWQTGAGCELIFSPKNKKFEVALRYGYGFNAIRNGEQGAQSVGLLFQYNFEPAKQKEQP